MKIQPLIVRKIFEAAALTPDRDALICGEETVRYARLKAKINSAAARLLRAGVVAGDRVILSAESGRPAFVYGYFACHQIGAVAVPVDKDIGEATLRGIVSQAQPRLACLSAPGAGGLASLPIGSLDCEDAGETRTGLVDPDEAVDLLYTAGTTGAPKGVMQSYRNIEAFAAGRDAAIACPRGDRVAIPLPLSHGFGLGRLRATMLSGGTAILIDGFLDPEGIFRAFERHEPSGFCCVPSGFSALFQSSGDRLGRYGSMLRYVETATAPLPDSQKTRLMRLLPNTRIYNSYGMTETTSSIAFMELHGAGSRLGSIGRPVAGVQFKIGGAGQVLVRGPNVMRGYWKDPARTEAVLRGGWLATNDVGYQDEDGYLYLTGRKEELINVGGLKVAPAEIEKILNQHPAVSESACVGAADETGGETVKAFMVAAPGQGRPPAEALLDLFRGQLEAYKIPSQFLWVDALPKTSSGKLQRARLKALDAPAPSIRSEVAAAPPGRRRRILEEHVRAQIARAARTPLSEIDGLASLGDIGLTSLMSLEIRNRLERSLEVSLPATWLWSGRVTIEDLVGQLAEKLGLPSQAEPSEGLDAASVRELLEKARKLPD